MSKLNYVSFAIGGGIVWLRIWPTWYRLCLKSPSQPVLFSERYGYRKVVFGAFGWRVLLDNPVRDARYSSKPPTQ